VRGHRARAVTVACGLVLVLLAAAPAEAQDFLAADDAVALADALAEATEEQDVCYGWNVVINSQQYETPPEALAALGTPSPAPTMLDRSAGHMGSNAGPGIRVQDLGCERWVEFSARLVYTGEYSESEDSASYEVNSNFTNFSADDRSLLGVDEQALLGDNDDTAVYTATSALPLIVADKGLAPHITAEPNATPLPAADRPTGSPGSDVLRSDPFLLAFLALLAVGGLGWLAYLCIAELPKLRRRRTSPQERAEPHPIEREP